MKSTSKQFALSFVLLKVLSIFYCQILCGLVEVRGVSAFISMPLFGKTMFKVDIDQTVCENSIRRS